MALLTVPGCARPFVISEFATSVTGAMRLLRRDGAATAAGGDGALNVWRDDEGMYRADFNRYFHVVGEHKAATLREIRDWLREWWPKMGR